jgi:hypothetical protein
MYSNSENVTKYSKYLGQSIIIIIIDCVSADGLEKWELQTPCHKIPTVGKTQES